VTDKRDRSVSSVFRSLNRWSVELTTNVEPAMSCPPEV